MKNNTVRIQRKACKKAPSSQVKITSRKTRFGPQFQIPEDATHQCCLVIFDRDNQEPAQKIPLSEDEFKQLWELAVVWRTERKGFLAGLVAEIIRKHLATPEDDGFDELENVIQKARGLLELMADKFEHLARLDSRDFTGPAGANYAGNIGLLVNEAQKNLWSAFTKAFAATHPKLEEVAP